MLIYVVFLLKVYLENFEKKDTCTCMDALCRLRFIFDAEDMCLFY